MGHVGGLGDDAIRQKELKRSDKLNVPGGTGSVYKTPELDPLRSTSLVMQSFTTKKVGWNSKNTLLSIVKRFTNNNDANNCDTCNILDILNIFETGESK